MKQKILQLFNNSALLDKECLKSGQKHIQHSVRLSSGEIEWIDAAYIGIDGGLYFFITDHEENIKSKPFEDLSLSDVEKWYYSIAERKKGLKPAKSIQEYKNQFAALYSEMIADFEVDKANISISWKSEKENDEWIKKPNVLITF